VPQLLLHQNGGGATPTQAEQRRRCACLRALFTFPATAVAASQSQFRPSIGYRSAASVRPHGLCGILPTIR